MGNIKTKQKLIFSRIPYPNLLLRLMVLLFQPLHRLRDCKGLDVGLTDIVWYEHITWLFPNLCNK